MKMGSREFQWIIFLVGGTFLAILLPAGVSCWMVYISIKSGSLHAIIVHGTLALLQASAIWNAYRVKNATFIPIIIPFGIVALHLVAKLVFHLPQY